MSGDEDQRQLLPLPTLLLACLSQVGCASGCGPVQDAAAQYLGFMQVRITEELAFLNGSTLYGAMLHGGGGARASGGV